MKNLLTTVQNEYTLNEFFYKSIPLYPVELSVSNCLDASNSLLTNSCSSSKLLNDNSYNCYVNELCINKQQSNSFFNMNNDHGKSNLQLSDTNLEYVYQYIQTINLGIGNIILISLILYKIYNS